MENLKEVLKEYTNRSYTLDELLNEQEKLNDEIEMALYCADYYMKDMEIAIERYEEMDEEFQIENEEYYCQVHNEFYSYAQEFQNIGSTLSQYCDIESHSHDLIYVIDWAEGGQMNVGEDNMIGAMGYNHEMVDSLRNLENAIKIFEDTYDETYEKRLEVQIKRYIEDLERNVYLCEEILNNRYFEKNPNFDIDVVIDEVKKEMDELDRPDFREENKVTQIEEIIESHYFWINENRKLEDEKRGVSYE